MLPLHHIAEAGITDRLSPVTHEYPGARRPDRRRVVDSSGLAISAVEWGDPDAPPIALVHGGFDFAETYNRFAPLLVERGWRVVSWDQRGHAFSEWAAMYSWEADLRDAVAVLDTVTSAPIPLIGHSKGGALSLFLSEAFPHRFSHLLNLDGLPSRKAMPDITETERTKLVGADIRFRLDHRAGIAAAQRKPGTIDELARRRARMNTRLEPEWLRYLVTLGAREDPDGWRWRIDPALRMGGFGPWSPDWSLRRLPGLSFPFVGVLGGQPEVMGWGTAPEDVRPFIPDCGELLEWDDVGHFVHIEQPERVAELVDRFIGAPRR